MNEWLAPLADYFERQAWHDAHAERQIRDGYAMRVAPGTDAVVFKPWDMSHEVCEL